jgi:hypothetical protein
VEDQGRAAAVTEPANQPRGWIVSPAFDLLFLANVAWPLLLLPAVSSPADTAIDFWQVYFVTLPHRWVTLLLVATDADRRGTRGPWLVGIAVLAALAVTGAYLGTGAFLCLALVDYVWNAWHFAAQHAGVLRIYTRKVGGGVPWLERWGLRAFVTYGALRAAGWLTGAIEANESQLVAIRTLDLAVLALPVALLVTNLSGLSRARLGKLAHLVSVCALYTGFILSLSFGWARGIVVFAAAGSLFHAVEYLAVVTHYARRRETVGSDTAFRALARNWVLFLGAYVLVLGSFGAWASTPVSGLVVLWQGLNLWAAFVHYAYDGMIWKLRRPETAAALGVSA